MPTNKNAVIRYMYLDDLLSDRHHEYTCRNLVEKVNDKMTKAGYGSIWSGDPDDYASAKRLIQLDLEALQEDPFNMEIDSSKKIGTAPIYRYADPTKTLFTQQISDDEKLLLLEVLNTLGKFSGLDNFKWLEDLRERLRDKRSFGNANPLTGISINNAETKAIMSFEENPYLHNKDYLPQLFSYIARRQTIIVPYKKFHDLETEHYTVFPYMLKQYATRWYLLCTPAKSEQYDYKPDLILSLPIDRFEGEVTACGDIPFIECAVNLEEMFEEIIGITYKEKNPVEKIIIAVRNDAFPYIDTKPLHETQTKCTDPQYQIDGYKTIFIKCRDNHELISKLCSYGDDLIVLAPEGIRNEIVEILKKQWKSYRLSGE